MHAVESEFKLRARRRLEPAAVDAALRELGVEVASSGHAKLGDIYLDDAGMELGAAGFGLRLRVAHGTCTITCKGPSELRGALFVRTEASAPWPAPTTPRTAADLPSTLRDLVEPVLLQRPLVPVLRLHTERETRVLAADGVPFCELAIDATEAHGSGTVVPFAELELEVLDDLPTCERIACALEARLQLQPSRDDKPTHALYRLGQLPPRIAPVEGLPSLLRSQRSALQRAESAVRARGDADSVHELRTAVRRLLALVTAFSDAWPEGEAEWLRRHLRAFARELGRVRDLDVLIAELPRHIAASPPAIRPHGDELLVAVQTAHRDAHAHLLGWLRSPQRLNDAQRFADLLRAPTAPAPITAEEAVHRLAAARELWRERARIAVEGDFAEHVHPLRIATRDLRLLAQELAPALGTTLEKPARRLQRLQEVLGRACDLTAMQQVLLALAEDLRATASPKLQITLGSVVQQLHDSSEAGLHKAARAIRRAARRRFLRPDAE